MLRRGVKPQQAQITGANGRGIDQPSLGVNRLIEVHRQPGHSQPAQDGGQQNDSQNEDKFAGQGGHNNIA